MSSNISVFGTIVKKYINSPGTWMILSGKANYCRSATIINFAGACKIAQTRPQLFNRLESCVKLVHLAKLFNRLLQVMQILAHGRKFLIIVQGKIRKVSVIWPENFINVNKGNKKVRTRVRTFLIVQLSTRYSYSNKPKHYPTDGNYVILRQIKNKLPQGLSRSKRREAECGDFCFLYHYETGIKSK